MSTRFLVTAESWSCGLKALETMLVRRATILRVQLPSRGTAALSLGSRAAKLTEAAASRSPADLELLRRAVRFVEAHQEGPCGLAALDQHLGSAADGGSAARRLVKLFPHHLAVVRQRLLDQGSEGSSGGGGGGARVALGVSGCREALAEARKGGEVRSGARRAAARSAAGRGGARRRGL